MESEGAKAGCMAHVLGCFEPCLEELLLLTYWHFNGINEDDGLHMLMSFPLVLENVMLGKDACSSLPSTSRIAASWGNMRDDDVDRVSGDSLLVLISQWTAVVP